MANDAAGSGASAVADKGADAGAADKGAAADAGKSILDGAQAPAKTGEPNGKAPDAADKSADASKTGDDKNQAGKDTKAGATGAPEKYELKAPEGITFDENAVKQFSEIAKGLNLSQDAAQKLVDFQGSQIKAAQEANLKGFEDMQKEWAAETRKELGANADKELGFAAVARDKFLNPDAQKVLNDSGLANHPAIIKSLIAMGKAISEDTFVEGKGEKGGGGKNAGKTAAQIIYPEHK